MLLKTLVAQWVSGLLSQKRGFQTKKPDSGACGIRLVERLPLSLSQPAWPYHHAARGEPISSRSFRPLSAPAGQLLQMGQGLSFSHVAKRRNACQLGLARPRCLAFPAIDGLACHTDELAVIRSRELQALPLRAQALGGESYMVCIGFGRLGGSVLEHLFFKRRELARQVGYSAFHLGNILAVLGRRLPENACLSADLLACKPQDFLFEYGSDVRHIFLLVASISHHVAPERRDA